jgi:hypothetical protein
MTNHDAKSLAFAAVVGLLSGAHTAIWGMYKDAIHEGFTKARFSRSVIIGALSALALQLVFRFPMPTAAGTILLFGLAYAMERGIVEVWKTFIRDEDQSKYTIPMQFAIRGKLVRNRGLRVAAGAAYVAVVALILLAFSTVGGPRTLARATVVGLAVGGIIAIGGAWKDAPTEGFDPIKFLRSPCLTVLFTIGLGTLTDQYLLIAVAAIGYERAMAETYKTFFFPSKPRGKFAGKPVLYPEMLRLRQYYVPAYVAIWLVVVTAAAVAMRSSASPDAPEQVTSVRGQP